MLSIVSSMKMLKQSFIHAIQKNRLGHAYLFEGMQGVGKRELALFLAKLVFCQERDIYEEPCSQCDYCRRIDEGNFPDVMEITPDGQTLKVDQMRELKQQLSKTAMEGHTKVCIIHDVDTLTTGAANSLLKFLEEPESSILFLLLTSRLSKVLPTIQSRCQIVHFATPVMETLTNQLEEAGVIPSVSRLLATLTSDLNEALELANSESFQQLRQDSWQWYTRVFQNRSMAFVTIQSQMMPLLTSKAEGQRFLELLSIYVRDSLYMAIGAKEQMIQKDKATTLQTIANQLSVQKWIELHEKTSKVLEKVQSNVGIQAALEQWVLMIF